MQLCLRPLARSPGQKLAIVVILLILSYALSSRQSKAISLHSMCTRKSLATNIGHELAIASHQQAGCFTRTNGSPDEPVSIWPHKSAWQFLQEFCDGSEKYVCLPTKRISNFNTQVRVTQRASPPNQPSGSGCSLAHARNVPSERSGGGYVTPIGATWVLLM